MQGYERKEIEELLLKLEHKRTSYKIFFFATIGIIAFCAFHVFMNGDVSFRIPFVCLFFIIKWGFDKVFTSRYKKTIVTLLAANSTTPLEYSSNASFPLSKVKELPLFSPSKPDSTSAEDQFNMDLGQISCRFFEIVVSERIRVGDDWSYYTIFRGLVLELPVSSGWDFKLAIYPQKNPFDYEAAGLLPVSVPPQVLPANLENAIFASDQSDLCSDFLTHNPELLKRFDDVTDIVRSQLHDDGCTFVVERDATYVFIESDVNRFEGKLFKKQTIDDVEYDYNSVLSMVDIAKRMFE